MGDFFHELSAGEERQFSGDVGGVISAHTARELLRQKLVGVWVSLADQLITGRPTQPTTSVTSCHEVSSSSHTIEFGGTALTWRAREGSVHLTVSCPGWKDVVGDAEHSWWCITDERAPAQVSVRLCDKTHNKLAPGHLMIRVTPRSRPKPERESGPIRINLKSVQTGTTIHIGRTRVFLQGWWLRCGEGFYLSGLSWPGQVTRSLTINNDFWIDLVPGVQTRIEGDQLVIIDQRT